jgi:hypothetical protein
MLEDMVQRKNSDTQHGALQLGHQAIELGVLILQPPHQIIRVRSIPYEPGGVANRILNNGNLTGQIDQRVNAIGIDTKRTHYLRAWRRAWNGCRLGVVSGSCVR